MGRGAGNHQNKNPTCVATLMGRISPQKSRNSLVDACSPGSRIASSGRRSGSAMVAGKACPLMGDEARNHSRGPSPSQPISSFSSARLNDAIAVGGFTGWAFLRCCAVRSAVALVAGFVNGDSSCCGFAEVAMGHTTEFRQQWAWISVAYSSQRTAGYEELRVIVPLGCVPVTSGARFLIAPKPTQPATGTILGLAAAACARAQISSSRAPVCDVASLADAEAYQASHRCTEPAKFESCEFSHCAPRIHKRPLSIARRILY